MTHFPAFQSLLFVFLLIQIAVGSRIELERLNSMLNVLTLKQETTQLEMKQIQNEVEQLRKELDQVRQQLDVSSNVINETKMKDSGENESSCEIAANLTKELINDIIFRMNQCGQSSSLRKDNSSIEEMNSTLYGILIVMEEIKSSILANSSNTTRMNDAEIRQIYSELQSLKGLIANMSRSKTSMLETVTTSSSTTTSSISMTSRLCSRMVTNNTLILASIKVGTRVVRGRDWSWGGQDGNPPTTGTVEKIDSLPGWVWVRWKSGTYLNYRVGAAVGADSKFDLYICK